MLIILLLFSGSILQKQEKEVSVVNKLPQGAWLQKPQHAQILSCAEPCPRKVRLEQPRTRVEQGLEPSSQSTPRTPAYSLLTLAPCAASRVTTALL